MYSINGSDVTSALKNDAVALIKAAGQVIKFVISDSPDLVGLQAFEGGGAAPPAPPEVQGLDAYGPVGDATLATVPSPGNDPGPGKVEVTVDTGGGKLGMSMAGPRDAQDPRQGIFVTRVKEESPANGIVPAYSRVYSIDGSDITDGLKNDAVALIKAAGNAITCGRAPRVFWFFLAFALMATSISSLALFPCRSCRATVPTA